MAIGSGRSPREPLTSCIGAEPQGCIEVDGVRFGIHDHPDAADTIAHLEGKLEHGPQQQSADAVSLKAFVHREPGKAQDG